MFQIEQLNFNTMKNLKNVLYPHNRVSNYNNKTITEINHYPVYSKQENKKNIKCINIYNGTSGTNYLNNELLDRENKLLTNYNSYSSKRMNSKQNISIKNNSILEQYSLKDHLQSKNHLNHLQRQRNTFDLKQKNLKNSLITEVQRVNAIELNNQDNPKILSKSILNITNNKELYEKNLLLNKLKASKSSNTFFIGDDDHDISIEYNNAPIIQNKRNNKYLNSGTNERIGYIYQSTNWKNKNDLKNDHSLKKNKNENTSYLNYESYISNSINRNAKLFNDKYINLTNINIDEEKDNNNNYLLKKRQLLEKKNTNNNYKKEIKIYNNNIGKYNHSLNKYQIPTNNNIYHYNINNTTNHNLDKINNQIKKMYSSNINIIKSKDIEALKSQIISKKNSNTNNNNIINTTSLKNQKSNNINKNNNNQDNNGIKSQLTQLNKSKKDIFTNKDYQNILKKNNHPPKKVKSNSPESKDANKYETNLNKNLLSVNYFSNKNKKENNKNYNKNEDKQKTDSKYEIFEVEYFNKNSNNNKNANKKNLSNRQKILLFRKDKINNIINGYNSVDIKNNDISNIHYNINYNTESLRISSDNKKPNLKEKYKSHEKDLESKNKTSRNKDSNISQYLNLDNENINANTNNYDNKSTKNIIKIDNKILISERKILSNSPPPINSSQYNINNNKRNIRYSNNINNNIKNTDYIEKNSKREKYYPNNISQSFANLKEEKKDKEIISKTETNSSNDYLKENKNNNLNTNINNYNSSSILKRINLNKQFNNNPVKLYLKKKEMNNNSDFLNKIKKDNNHNIYINNYLKQIDLSNKNIYNSVNKIKKYNSYVNNNKTNNNIINNNNSYRNNNNNIININNNTSNLNVLNVKNSSINICIEKKDKYNNKSPENNSNLDSPSISKNYKRNKINVKNTADELIEKNKNIKVIKPLINKTNTNYINPENESSSLKISTNTIRYNYITNDDKTENINNTKSYKNILIKSGGYENSYNINNKRKLMPNHSEIHIINKKSLKKESSSTNINNNHKIYLNQLKDNRNLDKNNIQNIKSNEFKNDIVDNNKGIIKYIQTPSHNNININNYYKKNNSPIISPNNSIQLNFKINNKNHSPNGIYIKPYRILSRSKPKKNIMKSKSELKITDNNNKNPNKNCIVYSLKRPKKKATSKSLNSEIFFHTSPTFYKKDEYFKKNIGLIKRCNTGTLNTSIITKNLTTNNIPYKDKNISYENNIWKNSIILHNIRDKYIKSYCFFNKIYNYYIKTPKIEKCYFVKNGIQYNNKYKKPNKDKDKNNILENNQKVSMVQDIVNINDEEKNNESSQNGLIMTFGEMTNNYKKYNEKSYAIINSSYKNNINNTDNIVSIIDNNLEDSDLDIFKSLQQNSHTKTKNKNDKNSNGYSSSNINISENEDLKIYESLSKENSIDQNIKSKKYKSTDGKEINEDFDEKKSKTFKKTYKYNLQNAEKGLQILGKLILRRGIKSNNDETLSNIDKNNTEDNIKNKNIYLGTNKLNELFNSRKETEPSNTYKKTEDDNTNSNKRKKYSNSINKDLIQGLSKIKNVLDKNNIINLDINLIENKINTYDAKPKINCDSSSNTKEYMDYSEILKSKIKTYGQRSGSSNEINTFDSYLDIINNNEINPRYKESEILSNNHKVEIRYSNDIKDSKDSLLPIKCNLLNDEMFNHCNDLLSYSEEEFKSNITNINMEEFEKYIKNINNKQSINSIENDIIYLLNILVESNYPDILNEITKLILYEKNDKNELNILYKNDDIIENINIFKNIIFSNISKGIKYIYLFVKICNDLNNNINNALNEQKIMKNNKVRNLKSIINDECLSIIKNNLNNNNNIENDEYYFLRKKIIGYSIFVYELINVELLKQQFGFFVLEQLYKLYKDINLNNEIKIIYLEGIIILINKLGKLVFIKKNNKLIQNIDNYIDNNLKNIINNENENKIPIHLKYKIMNIITKRDNKWEDTLWEKIEKEEKYKNIPLKIETNNINYNKMSDKVWNQEINIDDVNKSIIEEDLVNYISYFTEENNKGQINIKNNIDKSYNWKIIEELVNNKNFGLESIIYYFISVCPNVVNDDNELVISNDYIKNIIEYYANNLSKQAKDSIHNQMIKTFLNINEYVNKNQNMYKILGNLLYILIDNKLYHIKYFNHYLKLEKQSQINLAIITRYCIISSGKFAKKYLNDFKQTKLFINNEIFVKYVIEPLKDLLYFIQ